ncbi:MAG: nuclear transport factor 2 family protein [Bacteroidia bacterium]|nr:nuclear transport factor 2 family protein [Bacteroidia bacterium]
MKKYLFPLLILLLAGCDIPEPDQRERFKAEVMQAEADFAALAARDGVEAAFLHYAAEDGVMMRRDHIIQGHDAMQEYFAQGTLKDVKLDWKPDFVDVSQSGDLAYTYGGYTFSAVDTAGNPVDATGIFHTVWKRQADGQWRFVYD